MTKIGLFTVSYTGYLTVSAENEDLAMDIANTMLSESGIVNDGDSGEWQLADVTDENYWSNS
jgi:hypothetical protein